MASPGLVQVKKLATCKRCGNQQVAWYQTKAGKWMLCEALVVAGSHEVIAQIFQPHKCSSSQTQF